MIIQRPAMQNVRVFISIHVNDWWIKQNFSVKVDGTCTFSVKVDGLLGCSANGHVRKDNFSRMTFVSSSIYKEHVISL